MALEKYIIPVVSTDDQWYTLTGQREIITKIDSDEFGGHSKTSMAINPVRNDQLLVVDVYTEWSGPCLAVESHLRKLRHSFVDAPDTLALARACCDNIEYLQAFKHDIRPTFLFWARGGPVALLRGANRPLLTRLITEEVDMEAKRLERDNIEIDFYSDRVIQCQGELSDLESDEVVRSIGRGNTDRLSVVFNVIDTKRRSPVVLDETEEFNLTLSQMEAQSQHDVDVDALSDGGGDIDGDVHKIQREYDDQGEESTDGCNLHDGEEEDGYEDDYQDENSSDDEEMDDIQMMTDSSRMNNANGEDFSGDDLMNPFGKRRKKKKKKMEVGLLKEILDFKPVKRFGH